MPEQLPLTLPVRAALGRSDFIVGPCNARVVDRIDAWPQWSDPVQYIYGPVGCGKSHLATVWLTRHSGQLADAASLCLTNGPAHDWLSSSTVDTTAGAGLVVDGLEALTAEGEEVLFHIVNHARAHNLFVLLLARQGPAQLTLHLRDLRSRLTAMDALAFGQPDDTLLSALFDKLFRDRQLDVAPRVIQYLVTRVERNFHDVTKLVARIDHLSLSRQQAITIPLVSEAMTNLTS
ncbi:MAG: hypothetical protein CBD03_03245 [Rhizobiales bacterium TMED143]|nr:hypothetical protein [Rhodobiaceae bacterium]OUV92392.1 MAG: hypothetical protein CBD03_03245 [Rhizobiales bacterium TMED143]CAI8356124.1 MAG: DnaA regulatory inactivator Hda [Rhodobiaceae bacterium UBA7378]HCQ81965.1 hypothetical protein [Rhodobiaceae bacterium]|tara:strand:- start:512 stop:1213 length:702 start_codon:yes stop_codon:yes gene_type:complete